MLKASKILFILLKLIIFKIFVCKEHWKPYLQNLNPENELFICSQERERKHASIGLFNLCIELRQENVCLDVLLALKLAVPLNFTYFFT